MQDVVAVIADIVKQFIVRRLAQFIKRREVRRHESATRAATNERLDPLPVVCRGEPPPRTWCVLQLGNDDGPEDCLQGGIVHAVRAEDSERVQSLRARVEDRAYVLGDRQAVCDSDAEDFDDRDAGYFW